ncbi:MAG: 4-hydroxybenzoate octaprenyltransferase [Alphaproteobacteria bacterium]
MQPNPARRFTDIPETGWVARAPAWARPYLRLARLDRPIGTWLLLWPCWWSLALAADGWPDPVLLALFGVGALLMRGAGCCWNDIADRDIDGLVERTATRPIPAGELTVRQAVGCMVLLALLAFAILLTFNAFAIAVGVASLATVAIYPFMKRFTWWPQFFLGLAFNWGALLGWAAVRGEIGWPAILLYVGGIFWTLGYDTIYAHQDKEDDALVGIKSSARRLGSETRPALLFFYGAALALFVVAIWLTAPAIWVGPFLAVAGAQLAWQAATVRLDSPASCLGTFRSNNLFGLLLFAGIVAGRVL